MDTDINMHEDEQPFSLENHPPRLMVKELMFALRVYCLLSKYFPNGTILMPVRPGIDEVRIMKDQKLMGMPPETWQQPLTEKLLIFTNNMDIVHDCLLMKYGHSERINTTFYWTTEMAEYDINTGKQR